MKLAEALILRSDLKEKIESVKLRIYNNVIVQEGEEALEDPNELINYLFSLYDELETLSARINDTNNKTLIFEGMSISDALVRRDVLSMKRNALSDIATEGARRDDRYSHSEIKKLSLIDVASIHKKIDEISKEIRNLDVEIQKKNWTCDLI